MRLRVRVRDLDGRADVVNCRGGRRDTISAHDADAIIVRISRVESDDVSRARARDGLARGIPEAPPPAQRSANSRLDGQG